MWKNNTGSMFFLFILTHPIDTIASSSSIEYLVPEGFSENELEFSMELLLTFDDVSMPSPVKWSEEENSLVFDEYKYIEHGISYKDINILKDVLSEVPYINCQGWCEYYVDDHKVSLDKNRQTITIANRNRDFLNPKTGFGLVHNNYIDIKKASNGYSSYSLSGRGFLGLPEQSFASMNWYYNDNQNYNSRTINKSLGSWYLQKNFNDLYFRGGQQDSRDYSSNINTNLSPIFKEFVTFGSQNNLRKDRGSEKKMYLFSTQDVDFEFYRDGKLVKKIPGVNGKNEIDYSQLPSGFYTLEIRQVNRSGKILSKEIQQIANIDYGTGNGWFATLGKESETNSEILNAGINYQNKILSGSTSIVKGKAREWVFENNVSRPSMIGELDIQPTLGIMAGELDTGEYVNISAGNFSYGYFSISYYSGGRISKFYRNNRSGSFSYGRSIGVARVGYNYTSFGKRDRHQIQTTWSSNFLGLRSFISVGIERDTYKYEKGNVGMFANSTFILEKGAGSANVNFSNGKLTSGASYTKQYDYDSGKTLAGLDVNDIGSANGMNFSVQRSGAKGDLTVSSGVEKNTYNGRMNYSGMFAANSEGIGIGRASPTGAAMIVHTPDLKNMVDGFDVEDSYVGTNGYYAVPIKIYEDISYARVESKNTDVDMNIKIPANIVRTHPGQVYSVDANVKLNLTYSGFFVDGYHNPISGRIEKSDDIVFKNGLFSLSSETPIDFVTVIEGSNKFKCDLKKKHGNFYFCAKTL